MALYPPPVIYPPGDGSGEPTFPEDPFGTPDGVTALLGVRLPADVNVVVHLRRAHAVAMTWLGKVYPTRVPLFTGLAGEVVGDAEEALAAAGIMSRLLANVDNADWTAVNAWREDAKTILTAALPGWDPNRQDDPDGGGPLKPVTPSPVAVSSRGPYVSQGLERDPRTGDLIAALDADPWPY